MSQGLWQAKLQGWTDRGVKTPVYWSPDSAAADWSVFAAGSKDNRQNEWIPAAASPLQNFSQNFSSQQLLYLTEERYSGQLIYACDEDVMVSINLQDWEDWLWETHQGWQAATGRSASFGLVMAHPAIALPIALEALGKAKQGAKQHQSLAGVRENAVQVRVLYGNGDSLTATAKFEVFNQWRSLLNFPEVSPMLLEQAAFAWQQYPASSLKAIESWVAILCDGWCDANLCHLKTGSAIQAALSQFLQGLWRSTQPEDCDREVQSWLTLAAFILHFKQLAGGIDP